MTMKKLSVDYIQQKTSIAEEGIHRYYQMLRNYEFNDKWAERAKRRECPFCFFFKSKGMGVDTKFSWTCACCDAMTESYGREDHRPLFCASCADVYDICVKCGADRELAVRKVAARKKKRKES